MALFKISKGLSTNLMTNVPNAKEGFAYFTTDDGKFYIDIDGDGSNNTPAVIGNNRIPLNAYTSDILKATSMGTNDNVVYPLLTFEIKDSTKQLIEAKYGAIGIKNGTLVIPNVNNNDEILISNTGAGRGIVIDNTDGVGHAIEITAGKGIKVAQDPTENLELTTKQYVDNKLIDKSDVGHNHDDRYSTAISITIPKGRMLGDVDGDGEITGNDLTQMADHNNGAITLTGVDFWCADINGDGSITTVDINIANFYILGRPGPLSNTPLFTDYYNNWTYVKVDALSGYWTTEIATSGITTQNDIIINIFDLFSLGQFYKADILTNKIKLYATRPPIEDLKALITIRPGSGRVSIPAYSPEITLSSLRAAAQNHNHNSNYVIKNGDTMTGNLTIEKSSNSTSFTTKRTDTGASVSFMVGSDGTNRGVYDNNLNAWIIYSDGTDARTQLKLYGAVWNDYAEFRQGDTIEAGRCVIETGNDTLITSTERLMPGANITSDTFGFAIGETEQTKTPIAVSGRVLAYPYESREEFKKNIGRPVCSGPNGTVSIMTDEEYRDKGYCAIGTISAVPDYEEWGTGKVKVNGRVWIKVF